MEYQSSADIAKEWNVTQRWVSIMCKRGDIPGAQLIGHTWIVPKGTRKPIDKRFKRIKTDNKNEIIDNG